MERSSLASECSPYYNSCLPISQWLCFIPCLSELPCLWQSISDFLHWNKHHLKVLMQNGESFMKKKTTRIKLQDGTKVFSGKDSWTESIDLIDETCPAHEELFDDVDDSVDTLKDLLLDLKQKIPPYKFAKEISEINQEINYISEAVYRANRGLTCIREDFRDALVDTIENKNEIAQILYQCIIDYNKLLTKYDALLTQCEKLKKQNNKMYVRKLELEFEFL